MSAQAPISCHICAMTSVYQHTLEMASQFDTELSDPSVTTSVVALNNLGINKSVISHRHGILLMVPNHRQHPQSIRATQDL